MRNFGRFIVGVFLFAIAKAFIHIESAVSHGLDGTSSALLGFIAYALIMSVVAFILGCVGELLYWAYRTDFVERSPLE